MHNYTNTENRSQCCSVIWTQRQHLLIIIRKKKKQQPPQFYLYRSAKTQWSLIKHFSLQSTKVLTLQSTKTSSTTQSTRSKPFLVCVHEVITFSTFTNWVLKLSYRRDSKWSPTACNWMTIKKNNITAVDNKIYIFFCSGAFLQMPWQLRASDSVSAVMWSVICVLSWMSEHF